MTGRLRTIAITAAITAGAALAFSNLIVGSSPVGTSQAALPGNPLDAVIQARGLTPDEAEAALRTFVAPGKYDDFLMVTSGGHRGTILLYGIPSMRLLKEVRLSLTPPRNEMAGRKTAKAGMQEPVHIAGQSLDFGRDSRSMHLDGPVEAETRTTRLSAGELTLTLDKAFRAEKLESWRQAVVCDVRTLLKV